jgi:hypothetical protein
MVSSTAIRSSDPMTTPLSKNMPKKIIEFCAADTVALLPICGTTSEVTHTAIGIAIR